MDIRKSPVVKSDEQNFATTGTFSETKTPKASYSLYDIELSYLARSVVF